jgi:hypothetical protein
MIVLECESLFLSCRFIVRNPSWNFNEAEKTLNQTIKLEEENDSVHSHQRNQAKKERRRDERSERTMKRKTKKE